VERRIALLNQYTAAGFNNQTDAGALATRGTAAIEATHMFSLAQAVEQRVHARDG
jgi:hypothetical protein